MSVFKAYDVRGTYPDQIDLDLSYRVGRAFADYLGKANSKFPRVMTVRGRIPFVHRSEEWVSSAGYQQTAPIVAGELYEVDAGTLRILDGLEGHPTWYERKLDRFVDDNGQEHEAWIYYISDHGKPVETGTITLAADYETNAGIYEAAWKHRMEREAI